MEYDINESLKIVRFGKKINHTGIMSSVFAAEIRVKYLWYILINSKAAILAFGVSEIRSKLLGIPNCKQLKPNLMYGKMYSNIDNPCTNTNMPNLRPGILNK